MAEPLKKEVMAENDALKGENDSLKKTTEEMQDEIERLNGLVNTAYIQSHEPGRMEPMEQQMPEGMMEVKGETVLTENGLQGESEIIEASRIGNVDAPEFTEKMAYEQFMREPVTVHIHSTNEENPQEVFEISVNGRAEVFKREETKTVMRMYVEGLARAKPIRYKNVEYTDANGVRGVKWPSTTGLRYPFSIIQDANPNGHAWLKAILAQP